MAEVYTILLELLASALHDGHKVNIPDELVPDIREELAKQSVQCIPAEFAGMTTVALNLQTFYGILEEQDNIEKALSVPYVVLKGTAAAMNYPKPELRAMGDIDIIVRSEDFERAKKELVTAGYRVESDKNNRHLNLLSPDNHEIELHHHFSSSSNRKQNQILDDLIWEGISKRETAEIDGYTFPVLPRLQNGLVLLAHINQHLGTGLGLRQIIDWMCYVERELDDEFWKNEFSQAAESIGMCKLAVIVTAMCAKYLGLDGKITWWTECDDLSACEELMEYILLHGNFGRKDSSTNAVKVVRKWGSPWDGLRYAQMSGKYVYPVFQQYKILTPFAWIAAICRWVVLGMKKGIRPGSMKSISDKEKRETELLERLGVTRL